MTKIIIYEGNSFSVSRTFGTATTLSAYTTTFTLMENLGDNTPLIEVGGVVSGQGVVFTIPPTTLSKGVYHFEITGETATQSVTFEQDRLLVKESLVYIS